MSKVHTFSFLSNSKFTYLILKIYHPNINIILSIITVAKKFEIILHISLDKVIDLECKIRARRKHGRLFFGIITNEARQERFYEERKICWKNGAKMTKS